MATLFKVRLNLLLVLYYETMKLLRLGKRRSLERSLPINLLLQIEEVKASGNLGASPHLDLKERNLIDELQRVLLQEELLWLQKSRTDWIRDGERKTKFYHLTTMVRRNRNRVSRLLVEGTWVYDQGSLKSHVRQFFFSLFCPRQVSQMGG